MTKSVPKIDYQKATFLLSAAKLTQLPPDEGIEVAFVGRSNAGKSSAINVIANKHGLARTSKTPGRTQLINFFAMDEDRRLVDLPGYGYAKIPRPIQEQIERLLSEYLSYRQCLQGLILLMDIRHPLMPSDKKFIDYAIECETPVHILLTKSDKLKRGASQRALLETRKAIEPYPSVSVQTFSALYGFGIDEVHLKLAEWFSFDD